MTDEQRYKNLRKITSKFGIKEELTKLSEEIGELLNACYENIYTNNDITKIEDEFADVTVILSQIGIYFDLSTDHIFKIYDNKVERTIKRIDEGWYDKHR